MRTVVTVCRAPPAAWSMSSGLRSCARVTATRVVDRRRASGRARATAATRRRAIEALGGFGPNIDAEEIRQRQAAKQAKIAANRAAAEAAKSSKGSFSARAAMQQTVASRPSRAGRTMPSGAKVPSKTTSSKTTSSKTTSSAKAEAKEPKKKLFGLF